MTPYRRLKRTTGHLIAAATALIALVPGPLQAIQINLTYEVIDNGFHVPPQDADGAKLIQLAEAAATYWEGIIRDPAQLDIVIRYDGTISQSGSSGLTLVEGGRPRAAKLAIKGSIPWYYDQTPEDHSEYAMVQTLVRELSDAEIISSYVNQLPPLTPAVLENSYEGLVAAGAPVELETLVDLYSLLLHEIGHILGMSGGLPSTGIELLDGSFDVDPDLVNGSSVRIAQKSDLSNHTEAAGSLMRSGLGDGKRRLPSAVDVLAIATCPDPGWTLIDLPRKDFLPGGTTDWNTARNWVGNRRPDSLDSASIRHGRDSGNLVIGLSGNAFCKDLLLSSSTGLRTNSHKLDVGATATIEFDDGLPVDGSTPIPQLFVEAGGELEATDLAVNGGRVDLLGGLVDLAADLVLSDDVLGHQGILAGYGTMEVEGTLVNNGRIAATVGNSLVFNSGSLAPWDLDGLIGAGEVLALEGSLDFATGGMADEFDGWMHVAAPHSITFGEAWPLGPGGLIAMSGAAPAQATIAGALFQAGAGDVICSDLCRITAPVQWGGSLGVSLNPGAHVNLNGLATVDGGTYFLGADSTLEFNNNTSISGGAFAIPSSSSVRLDGTHTLQGGLFAGLGTLHFNGATTVDAAVTIDCGILDFDGSGAANKQVTLNNDLTINSGQIDTADNTFNSTLSINGSSSLLRVDGASSWTMAGVLHHDTGTPFTFPSIDGAPFTMSGSTSVNGGTRWDARATITGTVDLAAVGDRLALGSPLPNRIEGGTVTGQGTLRAFNTHLSGHGQIASKIDFVSNASLLADDGVLELSGPFTSVPSIIGTADSDGTLDVTNDWTLPAASVLELGGGIVTGGNITNTNITRGHGELMPNKFINNGSLSATGGQTLVIDSQLASDLDGVGSVAEVQTHSMDAIEGNIVLSSAPLDAFDGSATIAPGHSMSFLGGWQLGPNGTLQMTGNTASSPASLEGSNAILAGQLVLDDHVRIVSPASFILGSITALADVGTVLELEGDTSVAKGAVISGPGAAIVSNGNQVTLADGANVKVHMTNENGHLQMGAAFAAGRATLASYSQLQPATLHIDILGAPASSDWDQLVVVGEASIEGTLEVTFSAPAAQPGDVWKVLTAGTLNGSFDGISATGVPAGYVLQKIETAGGVYLKLATNKDYAKWAAEAGIPEGQDDGPADDPDGDELSNALEMFLGGNPLVPEYGIVPPLEVLEIGGVKYLSLTLALVWHNVPGDLEITVAHSTDLSNWSVDNVVAESGGFDLNTCIETRVYRSVFPFASHPREFLRIEAVTP